MKKIFLKIVTCFLAVVCLMGMVACNKPKLNIEKARKNLKANGYVVEVLDGDDCDYGIKEILSAESEDGEDWIEIICFEKASLARKYFEIEKSEWEEDIKCTEAELKYYEAILRYYEDEMSSEEIDEMEDEIKELKKALKEDKEAFKNETGRSGRYVWYGTKRAIKDTK